MTRCYICEKSDIMIPNSKVTYHGRKNGKKVQKTVRICNCCGAMMSDEEILEQVSECLGWKTNKLSCMIVLYLNCHLLRWQFFNEKVNSNSLFFIRTLF